MLKTLVLKNRSYRGFDESYRFTKEQLAAYVDMARLSASSANLQPLKYFCACDGETVKKIQPLTAWAGYLKEMNLPREGKRPTAFIVVCLDSAISENEGAFARDVGIAAQTILLAAAEEGNGGCMIGSFKKEEIAEMLPEGLVPMLVIALGRPDEEVRLCEVKDGDIKYFRDEDDVHFVPKRALGEVCLFSEEK